MKVSEAGSGRKSCGCQIAAVSFRMGSIELASTSSMLPTSSSFSLLMLCRICRRECVSQTSACGSAALWQARHVQTGLTYLPIEDDWTLSLGCAV